MPGKFEGILNCPSWLSKRGLDLQERAHGTAPQDFDSFMTRGSLADLQEVTVQMA